MKTTVRSILSLFDVTLLGRRGFTVTSTSVTGGTDGLLARSLVGGKHKVTLLKKLGFRA